MMISPQVLPSYILSLSLFKIESRDYTPLNQTIALQITSFMDIEIIAAFLLFQFNFIMLLIYLVHIYC